MGINELEQYIKERGGATVPEVQLRFALGYKETRELFKRLEAAGSIELKENLTYVGCEKNADENSTCGGADGQNFTLSNDECMERLKQRRLELLQRMREWRKDGEENAEESDEEDEVDEKLCLRALDFCVEYKRATPSLIQNRFKTGFLAACKIIDWMRDMGYLSESDGVSGGKILISREQFDKLYGDADFSEEGDEAAQAPFDVGGLITVLKAVRDKKSQPISAAKHPDRSLWEDGKEFINAVKERYIAIVTANAQGLDGAVREAETRLDGVRDTHDRAMVQIYERVVYELKQLTPSKYSVIRKKIC